VKAVDFAPDGAVGDHNTVGAVLDRRAVDLAAGEVDALFGFGDFDIGDEATTPEVESHIRSARGCDPHRDRPVEGGDQPFGLPDHDAVIDIHRATVHHVLVDIRAVADPETPLLQKSQPLNSKRDLVA